jgi:hypothetical protein
MADASESGIAASNVPFEPQPETVDALLAATVRVIEDERERGDTADTKAGQLVGFTGVTLAIEASLGSNVFDHGISGGYSYAFVMLFAVSLLALAAAACIAIRGLLSPQATLAFRREYVQELADGDLVLAESVEIKRTLIRTYGRELVSEEQRNNRKLDVVSRAGLLLLIGVVALAGEGGTIALEHLAMSTPKQQSPRPTAPSVSRPQPPQVLPLSLVKKGGSNPPKVGR